MKNVKNIREREKGKRTREGEQKKGEEAEETDNELVTLINVYLPTGTGAKSCKVVPGSK